MLPSPLEKMICSLNIWIWRRSVMKVKQYYDPLSWKIHHFSDDEQAFKEFCSALTFEPFGDFWYALYYTCVNLSYFLFIISETSPYLAGVSQKRKATRNDDKLSEQQSTGKRSKTFVPEKSKKIEKNDVRREYAQQFADAFNGCDKEILAALLHKLCLKNVVLVYKYVGVSNPYGPMNLEVPFISPFNTLLKNQFLPTQLRLDSWYRRGVRVLGHDLHGHPRLPLRDARDPHQGAAQRLQLCHLQVHLPRWVESTFFRHKPHFILLAAGTKVFNVDGLVDNSHNDVVLHNGTVFLLYVSDTYTVHFIPLRRRRTTTCHERTCRTGRIRQQANPCRGGSGGQGSSPGHGQIWSRWAMHYLLLLLLI